MPRGAPTLHDADAEHVGAPADAANALPSGHRLHEFELRGVIGVGGFGIVYRAFDHSLEREVAIKEYMPSALAGRSSKQQVSLLSAAHSETFALGLSSFVNEARLLARFDHPSLVKVHRFWEENGTAYMVMPLYRGSTLRRLRQQRDVCPGGAWLMRLTEQLLGALEVLHREGVYHRDIAPDNVLVSDDAPPVLLDFGAARRVISDRNQALTAILKPSYAPLEQYAESTSMRQGPWTDFYALGATLHHVITGKAPVPATARTVSDEQPRLAGSGQGGVPDLLLQACDWMLAPAPQDRPQNVAELRAALAGKLPVPQRTRRGSTSSWQNTVVQNEGELGASVFGPSELPVPLAQAERRARARPIWTAAAAMVIVAGGGAWWASARSTPQATPETLATARVAPAADSAQHPTATIAEPANESAAPTKPNAAQGATPAAAATAKPRAQSTAPARGQATASAKPKATPQRGTDSNAAARPVATKAGPPAGAGVPTAVAANDPAPGQAPVSVATATHNPRERCGRRHLLALHRCLVRECEKPEYAAHRECQRVRDIEAQTRAIHGSN